LERQEIVNKLNSIFRDVFDDDSIEIFGGMTAEDILDWDSLNHITLVINVEKEFGLKLNLAEVGKLENIDEMIQLLLEKVNS
jgi:acyl carrier protein|tara:strand:- start:2650 stop:2895 length:246 start_codon:yes stop_codon:yes gene_type:complete